MLAQSLIFFMAGYETVSSTLSYLFYSLALNQNIQDRLVDEINTVVGEKASRTDILMQLKTIM